MADSAAVILQLKAAQCQLSQAAPDLTLPAEGLQDITRPQVSNPHANVLDVLESRCLNLEGLAASARASAELATALVTVHAAEAELEAGPGSGACDVLSAAEAVAGAVSSSASALAYGYKSLGQQALVLLVTVSRLLARMHQQKAVCAAEAAAAARQEGDPRRAAEAAMATAENVGLAAWAASLGGHELIIALQDAQAAAVQASAAAARDAQAASQAAAAKPSGAAETSATAASPCVAETQIGTPCSGVAPPPAFASQVLKPFSDEEAPSTGGPGGVGEAGKGQGIQPQTAGAPSAATESCTSSRGCMGGCSALGPCQHADDWSSSADARKAGGGGAADAAGTGTAAVVVRGADAGAEAAAAATARRVADPALAATSTIPASAPRRRKRSAAEACGGPADAAAPEGCASAGGAGGADVGETPDDASGYPYGARSSPSVLAGQQLLRQWEAGAAQVAAGTEAMPARIAAAALLAVAAPTLGPEPIAPTAGASPGTLATDAACSGCTEFAAASASGTALTQIPGAAPTAAAAAPPQSTACEPAATAAAQAAISRPVQPSPLADSSAPAACVGSASVTAAAASNGPSAPSVSSPAADSMAAPAQVDAEAVAAAAMAPAAARSNAAPAEQRAPAAAVAPDSAERSSAAHPVSVPVEERAVRAADTAVEAVSKGQSGGATARADVPGPATVTGVAAQAGDAADSAATDVDRAAKRGAAGPPQGKPEEAAAARGSPVMQQTTPAAASTVPSGPAGGTAAMRPQASRLQAARIEATACSSSPPQLPQRIAVVVGLASEQFLEAVAETTPEGHMPPPAFEAAASAGATLVGVHTGHIRRSISLLGLLTAQRRGLVQSVLLGAHYLAEGPPAGGGASWAQWRLVYVAGMRILGALVDEFAELAGCFVEPEYADMIGAVVAALVEAGLAPACSRLLAAAADTALAPTTGYADAAGPAAAAGTEAPTAAAAEPSAAGRPCAGSSSSDDPSRDPAAWAAVVGITCEVMTVLCIALSPYDGALHNQGLAAPPLCARFCRAFADSGVAEHGIRASLVLLAHCSAHGDAAPDLRLGVQDGLAFLLNMAGGSSQDALRFVLTIYGEEASGAPAVRVAAPASLRHLLLMHAVSQLCAVDGGTDYGLPPGARLPAFTGDFGVCWDAREMAGGSGGSQGSVNTVECSGSGCAGGQRAGGEGGRDGGAATGSTARDRAPPSGAAVQPGVMVKLLPDVICNTLTIMLGRNFGRLSRGPRPCPLLRPLCLRLAAASQASWEALEDDAAAGGAAGQYRRPIELSGAAGQVRFIFSRPERLAMRALSAAVNLPGGASTEGALELGPLVVAVARRCISVQPCDVSPADPVKLLDDMLLLLPQVGMPLPPEPPPGRASALKLDLVACFEQALRHLARDQAFGNSSTAFVNVLLLGNMPALTVLFGYGNRRAAASLVATCVKLLWRRTAGSPSAGPPQMPMLPVPDMHALEAMHATATELLKLTARLQSWDGSGAGPADRHWWLRVVKARSDPRVGGGASGIAGDSDGARCGGPGSSGVGGQGMSSASSSAGGGAGGQSGGNGAVRLPPLHQLLLLGTFTLSRMLRLLLVAIWRISLRESANAGEGDLKDDDGLARHYSLGIFKAILTWVPPLVLAHLESHEEAQSAAGGISAAGGASDAAAGITAAPRADCLWRHVLLHGMCLPQMLAHWGVRLLPPAPGSPTADGVGPLVEALLHMTVAFPEGMRFILAGMPGALLPALQNCFPHVGQGPEWDAVRFFFEVAPLVAEGQLPDASHVARLRSGEYYGSRSGGGGDRRSGSGDGGGGEGGSGGGGDGGGGGSGDGAERGALPTWAHRLAPLLPPLDVVDAMLQLPPCSYIDCTNMEGDSEAGLRLLGCARCRGAVSYCSKGCQVAHWRDGHRETCRQQG